jgi:hypothetical protein
MFKSGDIAISKNKAAIIADPIASKTFINQEIIDQWSINDYKRTLDSWKEIFNLTNGLGVAKSLSASDLSSAQGISVRLRSTRLHPL